MYDERLTVPWWWYPFGAGLGGLLAAEIHLGAPGLRAWLPYVLTVPLALAGLWWLGRARLRLAGGELRVRDAALPVRAVEHIEVLDARAVRLALGRQADPAAVVLHRPWVAGGLRLTLPPGSGPVPYWLVSTRRPAQLAAAVAAAREPVPG